MFLAWNEIKHAKLRYTLVVGVMFLIAYLVFFLTGLSYGLAQENRMAIDKWDADTIILNEDANNNLARSQISVTDAQKVKGDNVAELYETPSIVTDQKSQDAKKIDVNFFGVDPNQFLMPNVVQGTAFQKKNEVIADLSLKEQYHLNIGDQLKLSGSDETLTIAGFTDHAQLDVSPVLYMNFETYRSIQSSHLNASEELPFNAIVVKGDINSLPDHLKALSISQFISALPGYKAEVLTFGFMIGFLIVIAAIVIGIFIYVLTMQKMGIFGVLKAQGITGGFIARSVVTQTLSLSIIGVGTGLIGTMLTALLLPEAVPFQSNVLFYSGISVLMVVTAGLGALFSVRTIIKIDPLKAIE